MTTTSAHAKPVVPWSTSFQDSESVESLKGELAVAKREREGAIREREQAEGERQQLVKQVVDLEAKCRSLHQEAEQWRHHALDFEQQCATYAAREDSMHAQVREAHNRQRDLAVKHIEGRISQTQAENSQAKAEAEARTQVWQSQQLESKLNSRVEEAQSLRRELAEERSRAQTSRLEVESLGAQLKDRSKEQEELKAQLAESEHHRGLLNERVKGLETAMQAASHRHLDNSEELNRQRAKIEDMEAANARLRLDLQEAINQAVRTGELPFYSGARSDAKPTQGDDSSDKEPPTMGVWSTLDRSPLDSFTPPRLPRTPLSPKSRLDYPKSSHARELRQKVLNSREDALNQIDSLRTSLPA